eukprot:2423266-Pyramimonas_sp.AAC.1
MAATIFDALASAPAPCNIAVHILGVSHSAICICVFVDFTLARSALDALGAPVDGVLSAGHIDNIKMFGREKAIACLKLLVERRGSETEASRGPSELQ